MAHLYIANTSKQHHDFAYRLPEEQNIRYEPIRAGSQVRLPGDLPHDLIQRIVKQHECYGMKSVSELQRNRHFVGLCYSVDKPISLDAIHETFETNDVAMNERAEDRREETAAAIGSEIQSTMQAHGANVSRSEVETIEDTKGTPTVASGYEILSEGTAPRHGSKPGRKTLGRNRH
jgi:hypothetical protein